MAEPPGRPRRGPVAHHRFRVLYVAGDDSGRLFQIFLKAPVDRWEELEPTFATLVEHLKLGDP